MDTNLVSILKSSGAMTTAHCIIDTEKYWHKKHDLLIFCAKKVRLFLITQWEK